ncbi:substrate-binding and VWA domain-containing protein [Longispora albida]|uniref:substrate-binding and VWA domain-containing protein n=1 Tax=Longispora albida TaxID=203523 RepID=UPI000379AC02|nr:substrate-binding and VWA domain-containing protein [Longispora albida]
MPPHGRHANVRSHRRGGPRRRLTVAPWIVIASVSALVLAGGGAGAVYIANSGCSGDPVTAQVLADPAIAKILDKLAREWQDTEPVVTDAKDKKTEHCAAVDIVAKDSSDVSTALGSDWDPRINGPQPDVWVPASTAWVRKAANNPLAERTLPTLQPSLARTPTVIAMPEPMVKVLQAGAWAGKRASWNDLITALGTGLTWDKYGGKAEWGPLKVAMTDPSKSTPGLHALMAVTDADDDGDVSSEERQSVWNFKKAVQPEMYMQSTDQIFAGLAKADAQSELDALKYVSGFPALERDIIAYNAAKPKVPLVAVYPSGGSADADNPYLVLERMAWADPNRQAVAKAFLTFLRGDSGRETFLADGFRDSNRIGGQNLNSAAGIQPQMQTLPRAVLLPESVQATYSTWTALARPVNVLLVMDVTGSMNDPVPGTNDGTGKNKTRLDLAKEAAVHSIGMFGQQARVGLWAFSTPQGQPDNYRKLAPIAILDTGHRQTLINQVNGLQANGATALYNTTWDAYQEVQKNYLDEAARNVVVVITDGEEETVAGGLSLDALTGKIKDANKANGGKKPVKVITIGYGPKADAASLQAIAQSSEGRFHKSQTSRDITTVLVDALFG